MNAFLTSIAVLVAIAVVAAFVLGAVDMSSETVFSSTSGNVRP